ncbi:MAG TPA: hypothetical protein VFQ45_07330 [Longimicrobium sp.]|nr:hypothetical protein [Longimicrobium sp.]
MRSISLQVRTRCGECGGPLPLNAMVERLACPACGAENRFGGEFWESLLGDADLSSATVLMQGWEIDLKVGGKQPECADCGTAIPAEGAIAAAEAGSVACPGCGRGVSVRVPPRPFVVSGIELLVGEDALQLPAGGTTARVPDVAQPVAFNCPQCGGVLQVDGSARVVACAYCSGSVYLPDALWHALHPVPKTRRWYMLARPGGRSAVRKEAENPATAPERLAELAGHLDYDVRENVARNPATPADALRRLVEADDSLAVDVANNPALPPELVPVVARQGGWSTLGTLARNPQAPPEVLAVVVDEAERRWGADEGGDAFDVSDAGEALEALASNPAASAELLERVFRLGRRGDARDHEAALARHVNASPALLSGLARDAHEDVRREVAAHPATPPAALEALAADADDDTRQAVARRAELGAETLRRLGRDATYAVREAARGNRSYPRWSWLKRLFGG